MFMTYFTSQIEKKLEYFKCMSTLPLPIPHPFFLFPYLLPILPPFSQFSLSPPIPSPFTPYLLPIPPPYSLFPSLLPVPPSFSLFPHLFSLFHLPSPYPHPFSLFPIPSILCITLLPLPSSLSISPYKENCLAANTANLPVFSNLLASQTSLLLTNLSTSIPN